MSRYSNAKRLRDEYEPETDWPEWDDERMNSKPHLCHRADEHQLMLIEEFFPGENRNEEDDLTIYRQSASFRAMGDLCEAASAEDGEEETRAVIFMLHPEHSPIIVTEWQFYDRLATMQRRIVNWPIPGTDCCLTFDKAVTFPMGDRSVVIGPCFITSAYATRTSPELVDAVTGLLEMADRWNVFCDGERNFHGFFVDRVPDKMWWERENDLIFGD